MLDGFLVVKALITKDLCVCTVCALRGLQLCICAHFALAESYSSNKGQIANVAERENSF